jgi:hypothetical protein
MDSFECKRILCCHKNTIEPEPLIREVSNEPLIQAEEAIKRKRDPKRELMGALAGTGIAMMFPRASRRILQRVIEAKKQTRLGKRVWQSIWLKRVQGKC